MSDLELLFLVLAALYLWECACWVRRGSVVLLTWLGRHWRVVHPGTLLANQHGAFIFTAPLPPLGNLVCGNQLPISISPDGVLAFVSSNVNPGWRSPQTGRFVRFDEIQSIDTVGKKVRVNGRLLLKASSAVFAQHLVRDLLFVKKIPSQERGARIERLFRDSLDEKAISQRWDEFLKRNRPIRWLANALFVYLFLLVPVIIWTLGFTMTWWGLLIGLLALTTGTALTFRSAHKYFYPEAEDDRFTHFLTILLSPATAMRAQDILSRPLLEAFHPLALTRKFCDEAEFSKMATCILREVRFPALPVCPPDPDCRNVEAFSRDTLRRVVEEYLIRNGIQPDELAGPPVWGDASCQTYCPRCHAQFTLREGTCSDCGGLALVEFR